MSTSPFPVPNPEQIAEKDEADLEQRMVLHTLKGYIGESEEARKTGPNPRDEVWELNWDAYWCRSDATGKQNWQANNVMPEVPQYVERFTAAIAQALIQSGQWFTITDPVKKLTKIMPIVERTTKILLDRSGRNQMGHRIGFEMPFGDAVKAGCMMMVALCVKWQDGALRVEPVDARELYYDPSGRGLYRRRRYKVDLYEVEAWAEQEDSEGNPLFDKEAISRLTSPGASDAEETIRKEKASGHGMEERWQRKPVTIDEFLCTILDLDGKAKGTNQLVVVGNETEIIRGPEPNPNWHGRDWIVAAPLLTVPFSVYGRTYVESFRLIADAFTEFTNLIHDAVFTNAMNAYIAWPNLMADPGQLNDGVSPNKVFMADEDECDPGQQFIQALELGNPQAVRDAVAVWTGMKQELREGASQNELALGQLPPKGDITATEIIKSDEGGNALVAHIAGNLENLILGPVVELAWMTGLQNLDPDDPDLADELSPEVLSMLASQREDFRSRRFRFKAKGITGIIERGRKVRELLNFLTVVSGNQLLAEALLKRFSGDKLMDYLMRLFGIDPEELEKSQEEKMRDALEAAKQAAVGQGALIPGQGGGSAPAPKAPAGALPV